VQLVDLRQEEAEYLQRLVTAYQQQAQYVNSAFYGRTILNDFRIKYEPTAHANPSTNPSGVQRLHEKKER
jgi:hypothetical protein